MNTVKGRGFLGQKPIGYTKVSQICYDSMDGGRRHDVMAGRGLYMNEEMFERVFSEPKVKSPT